MEDKKRKSEDRREIDNQLGGRPSSHKNKSWLTPGFWAQVTYPLFRTFQYSRYALCALRPASSLNRRSVLLFRGRGQLQFLQILGSQIRFGTRHNFGR